MLFDIDLLTRDELQFLNDWEEVYKKGITTFWVLFHLSKQTCDAKTLWETLAQTDSSINEHSIYRLLRRLYDVGLINQTHSEGRNKFYTISDKGSRILTAFTARNIEPLSQSSRKKHERTKADVTATHWQEFTPAVAHINTTLIALDYSSIPARYAS